MFTEGSQVPLRTLLVGKRAFERYPTPPAQKSHTLHISHVRNPRHRSCLQGPLPGLSPSLISRQLPALLCAVAAEHLADGCCAISRSGRLQPSAEVSSAGEYKAQVRVHQLINMLSTGFSGLWIKPLTNFFQLFVSQQPESQCSLHIQHRSHPPHFFFIK